MQILDKYPFFFFTLSLGILLSRIESKNTKPEFSTELWKTQQIPRFGVVENRISQKINTFLFYSIVDILIPL